MSGLRIALAVVSSLVFYYYYSGGRLNEIVFERVEDGDGSTVFVVGEALQSLRTAGLTTAATVKIE